MSILIKGMEMPRNCWECKFSSEYDVVDGTALGCQITMKTKEKDLKPVPDWCPLVPIPPHGRLIDANALLNAIKKAGEDDPVIADIYEEDYAVVSGWIYTAPTVIPARDINVRNKSVVET